ncbi:MAG: DUF2971 domain-containing protein [Aestuariivirga sp.]
MKLYHFTTAQFGLEAVRDERLKIALINELNDPFELSNLVLNSAQRKKWREWKTKIGKTHGLVCLSTTWKHPLLWSHYADKHKGMCLGFEVSANVIFSPVEYSATKLTLKDLGFNSLNELDEPAMQKILFTKWKAWEYELEYRAFVNLDQKDPVNGHYFIKFAPALKLCQVILGQRSDISRARIENILGKPADDIEYFKSRSGVHHFEIVENKDRRS